MAADGNKSTPKIFVGTLECGEAEFGACCDAVKRQCGVEVTHRVISGLPELAAHNALWQAWLDARASHDMFVKIDADTVLNRDTALSDIAALFQDSEVTGAQILLHDYFTDGPIAGLNAFSPAVEFRIGKDRLFADRVDVGHRKILRGEPVAHLAPIGWHCQAPHPQQAFHFGLHRMLKRQQDVIALTARAWLVKQGCGREWALAGAMSAGWRLRSSFDYGDGGFRAAFARLERDETRAERVERFACRMERKVR
jgi:hypothetical protein